MPTFLVEIATAPHDRAAAQDRLTHAARLLGDAGADLIEAVPELPFETADLNLSNYTGWTVVGDTLTFSPDGPALSIAHDEAAGTLHLTRSGEMEIQSMEVNGASSKTGTVTIEITMMFTAK